MAALPASGERRGLPARHNYCAHLDGFGHFDCLPTRVIGNLGRRLARNALGDERGMLWLFPLPSVSGPVWPQPRRGAVEDSSQGRKFPPSLDRFAAAHPSNWRQKGRTEPKKNIKQRWRGSPNPQGAAHALELRSRTLTRRGSERRLAGEEIVYYRSACPPGSRAPT